MDLHHRHGPFHGMLIYCCIDPSFIFYSISTLCKCQLLFCINNIVVRGICGDLPNYSRKQKEFPA
jgi:hypothetical protein